MNTPPDNVYLVAATFAMALFSDFTHPLDPDNFAKAIIGCPLVARGE